MRKLFPLMEDKKSLASVKELAEIEGKASLLAAVDYYVSLQSDIFISASPGNMHNALVRIFLSSSLAKISHFIILSIKCKNSIYHVEKFCKREFTSLFRLDIELT